MRELRQAGPSKRRHSVLQVAPPPLKPHLPQTHLPCRLASDWCETSWWRRPSWQTLGAPQAEQRWALREEVCCLQARPRNPEPLCGSGLHCIRPCRPPLPPTHPHRQTNSLTLHR